MWTCHEPTKKKWTSVYYSSVVGQLSADASTLELSTIDHIMGWRKGNVNDPLLHSWLSWKPGLLTSRRSSCLPPNPMLWISARLHDSTRGGGGSGSCSLEQKVNLKKIQTKRSCGQEQGLVHHGRGWSTSRCTLATGRGGEVGQLYIDKKKLKRNIFVH